MTLMDEGLLTEAVIEIRWPALTLLGVLLLLLTLRARHRTKEAAEHRRQWREITDRYAPPSGHLLN